MRWKYIKDANVQFNNPFLLQQFRGMQVGKIYEEKIIPRKSAKDSCQRIFSISIVNEKGIPLCEPGSIVGGICFEKVE